MSQTPSTPNIPQTPAIGGKLPSVIQLMTEAKNLFSRRFWYLVSLTLVADIFGPMIAFGIGFGVAALAGFAYAWTKSIIALIVLGIVALVVIFAVIVLKLIFTMAPMVAISDEKMVGIKEAIMAAKPKVGAFFLTSLLYGLIVMVASVFLVIPGVYFGVAMFFGIWLTVLDGVEGMDALKKSRELVRGRWWAVFARFLALGVVAWIVFALPNLMFQSLKLEWLGIIYGLVLAVLFKPFATAYQYLLFKAVKEPSAISPRS